MARPINLLPDEVATAAELSGVPPELALAIWQQESSSGANAKTSAKGARGGFQVMPDTFRRYHPTGDINDPVDNMQAGLSVLADGLRQGGGDHEKAAQFYYHGRVLPPGVEGPTSGPGTPTVRQYGQQVAAKARNIVSARNPSLQQYAAAPANATDTQSSDELGLDNQYENVAENEPGMGDDVDIPGLTRGFNTTPFNHGVDNMAMNQIGQEHYDVDQYIRKLVDDEFANHAV